jgi:hypothetical protein
MNHNLICIMIQRCLIQRDFISGVRLLTINNMIYNLYDEMISSLIIKNIFTRKTEYLLLCNDNINLLICPFLTTETLLPLLKIYLRGEQFYIYDSTKTINGKKCYKFFNQAIYGINGLFHNLMSLLLYNKMKFCTIKKILKKYPNFTRYLFVQIFGTPHNIDSMHYSIFNKYTSIPQFPHKQQLYFKWPKLMKYLIGQILGTYYSHIKIKFFRNIEIANIKSIIMDWQIKNQSILDQLGKPPPENF